MIYGYRGKEVDTKWVREALTRVQDTMGAFAPFLFLSEVFLFPIIRITAYPSFKQEDFWYHIPTCANIARQWFGPESPLEPIPRAFLGHQYWPGSEEQLLGLQLLLKRHNPDLFDVLWGSKQRQERIVKDALKMLAAHVNRLTPESLRLRGGVIIEPRS